MTFPGLLGVQRRNCLTVTNPQSQSGVFSTKPASLNNWSLLLLLLLLCCQGVVYEGREDLTPDNYLNEVAVKTHKRTLQEAVDGADVFLGLSVSETTVE